MVVVAIVAVLAALAGPSLAPTLERWRVRQAVEEMALTYSLARSEAIKRGGNISVMRSTPDTDQCALPAGNADWSCGWTVFVDANNNGALDSGEATLRVSPPLGGVTVKNVVGDSAAFTLSRWGEPSGSAVAFAFASKRTGSTVVTALCVGGGGRIRSKQGASTCS